MIGAIQLQRRDFPAAQRAYTHALNINPGSVEDLVVLGYTYAANNDYMQAETAFRDGAGVAAIDPDSRQSRKT